MPWSKIIKWVISIAIIIVFSWILLRINKKVFRKVRENKSGLHLIFFERMNIAIIVIACVILVLSVFSGVGAVWKTLLSGTAIISAVLAFAAQDIIKDILAGLMISIYKPFEIGNRIELEDGSAGIVKDISMRHVVIRTIDTQEMIIPNSKLNGMTILNDSYHSSVRSAHFYFYISYSSDVKKAMKVIRECVINCRYAVPGKQTENGMDYAPVYFLAYETSSLKLATTVYYTEDAATEVVKSEINLLVNEALKNNGIEIPYNYLNVIHKN